MPGRRRSQRSPSPVRRGSLLLTAAALAVGVMSAIPADVHRADAATGDPAFPGSVEAGSFHTCGLNGDGRAWCWGRDNVGQLGDGPGAADSYSPKRVAGDRAYSVISAGAVHTCALDLAGRAWCWGSDTYGSLGDGDEPVDGPEYTPVAVVGDRNYRAISAGNDHTCAIDTAGTAWCWGAGDYGQVGDGPGTAPRFAPSPVAGAGRYRDISAGSEFSCAVDDGGQAWCWGSDSHGKLGDGDETMPGDEFVPVGVFGGRSYESVSAGIEHACALDPAGRAWCWGMDGAGQVGDGAEAVNADEPAPVPVWGDRTYSAVAAGTYHTCATDDAESAWCWGADAHQQLGDDPSPADRFLPVPVAGGYSHLMITAGLAQTCSLASDATIRCWGGDSYGEIGDGDDGQTDQIGPIAVAHPWASAPTAMSAAPGTGQVVLSWLPPADDGGYAVTGYRVELRTRTGPWRIATDTTGSAATTWSATGLAVGTEYAFRAAAVTAAGIGVRSQPSAYVSALAPGPTPTTPTAKPVLRSRVAARAVSRKGRLRVAVRPDLGERQQWRFTIQTKRPDGWRALRRDGATKVWRTRGPDHVRILNLPRGRYRAKTEPGYGYRGSTSTVVRLRR